MDLRKQRIEAIFGATIELTTHEQRAVCLARVCGADPQLRLDVEELLQVYDKGGDYLHRDGQFKEGAAVNHAGIRTSTR
jgi:hypothetical protein